MKAKRSGQSYKVTFETSFNRTELRARSNRARSTKKQTNCASCKIAANNFNVLFLFTLFFNLPFSIFPCETHVHVKGTCMHCSRLLALIHFDERHTPLRRLYFRISSKRLGYIRWCKNRLIYGDHSCKHTNMLMLNIFFPSPIICSVSLFYYVNFNETQITRMLCETYGYRWWVKHNLYDSMKQLSISKRKEYKLI